MFSDALRASTGAGAPNFETPVARPALDDDERIAIRIFCASAAAALFFVWLASPDARWPARWNAGRAFECTSFGRGGGYCVEKPASAGQPAESANHQAACVSAGRAGRVCFGERG